MGNALNSSGLPVEIGEEVCTLGPAKWVLHEGKLKSTGEPVSIFQFNKKVNSYQVEMADNFFKRLKTLRHPHILAFKDGIESDSTNSIITEAVLPLDKYLQKLIDSKETKEKIQKNIIWGFKNILEALGFINEDCKFLHGAISLENIMVTKGGDWKLSSFYVLGEMHSVGGPSTLFCQNQDIVDEKYKSPERKECKFESLTAIGVDVFSLGKVLEEAFNGNIPKPLTKLHGLMTSHAPNKRPSAKRLLTHSGLKSLIANKYCSMLNFLDEWQLKSDSEKMAFLNELDNSIDEFPKSVCAYKILPSLRDALNPKVGVPGGRSTSNPSTGAGAGASTNNVLNQVLLKPFLKCSNMLDNDVDFQRLVLPTITKLFNSNDRSVRVLLLQNLPTNANHLDSKLLNGDIFNSICSGFTDSAPQMREATLKSVVFLAPKLSKKNLNEVLLRNLVVLLKDREPSIRTNTLICLNKTMSHFDEETKKKVVLGSFPQGARDQFIPARLAALRGMMANLTTVETDGQALAGKVIPGITYALVDPSPEVRSLAFIIMEKTVETLKQISNERAVEQNKVAKEAEAHAAEQRRIGEISSLNSGSGPIVSKSNTSDDGYLSAAAGWAGTMFTRAGSVGSSTKDDSSTKNEEKTIPSSPKIKNSMPKKTMNLNSRKQSSGSGFSNVAWGEEDDDIFGASDNKNSISDTATGNDGWGDEDLDENDLMSGLNLNKEKPNLQAAKKMDNDFFNSVSASTTLSSKKISSTKVTSKRENSRIAARQKIAAKREKAKAAKAVVLKKNTESANDDWDNW